METKKLEIEVPKEINEVGECIKAILIASATALKDGFQPGQDIPVILASAFGGLMTAIGDCQKIPEEFTTLPVGASLGILLPVAQGVEEMIKTFRT